MSKLKRYLLAVVSIISVFAFVTISDTADVPNTLNYQGTLTDNTGQPVSGSHQIIFSLYDLPAGGTLFWSETQTVLLTNGRFSVALGKTTPLDTSKFTGTTYIGIKVDTGAEMAPRQQLTSVAYALKAGSIFNIPETIPKGGIIMWSGQTNQIPAGWALCDGTNGTPNLKDKFIIGAGNLNPGNTGGEATHTLTSDEMPTHTHGVTDPGHKHSYTCENDDGQTKMRAGGSGAGTYGPYSNSILSNTTGIALQNAGSGAAHNNLPPYYALAFIMKL